MKKPFRRIAILSLTLAAALTMGVGGAVAVNAATPLTPYGPVTYPIMGGSNDVWTCSGYRLDAGSAVQDHFTCTIANQTFSGTFTEARAWPCGCSGWWSDADAREATSYVINVLPNGTVVGTAWY